MKNDFTQKIYCCYSLQQKNFLSEQGIKYDICALNPHSHNTFWGYVRDEKLDSALTRWSQKK